MKLPIKILALLILLDSALPCFTYSQYCGAPEPVVPSTENCEDENNCSGECSPFMQCSNCVGWFILTDISFLLHDSDINIFSTSADLQTIFRTPQEIFNPPER